MSQELFKPENQKAIGIIMRMVVPGISNEEAEQLAECEIENLKTLAMYNPIINECHAISAVAAVRSVIRMGLSLDPNLKLVYVQTRNVKHGDNWIKKLEISPSVNGLIYMAQDSGKLQDFERPEVEYDSTGKVSIVTWRYKTGNEWKEVTRDVQDFERLMKYSAKQNNGKANALYTSHNGGIDPEFASTKTMKSVLTKLGINPLAKRVKPDYEPVINEVLEDDNGLNIDL
jgi:hypothetical protein